MRLALIGLILFLFVQLSCSFSGNYELDDNDYYLYGPYPTEYKEILKDSLERFVRKPDLAGYRIVKKPYKYVFESDGIKYYCYVLEFEFLYLSISLI